MRYKFLIRPSLTVIFGFLGAFVARGGTPPEIFAITGSYFLIIATLAFGIFGFILPDIVELAGKAGIAALARQIAKYLPRPHSVRRFSFRRKKKNPVYQNPLIIDTSALIDGRLKDVVKTGFVYGTFLVIPSIITELHSLADSHDNLKRSKGRRGLEALEALQKEKLVKVELLSQEPQEKAVDIKLIKLAKNIKGKIVTVDYNLNKVAKVKGVFSLNINELANALKTAVLPNDRLKVHIKNIGKERNQGVGYLEDGTMVVVEDGAGQKGQTVEVTVHRVLQTAAGKMIFAKSS